MCWAVSLLGPLTAGSPFETPQEEVIGAPLHHGLRPLIWALTLFLVWVGLEAWTLVSSMVYSVQ